MARTCTLPVLFSVAILALPAPLGAGQGTASRAAPAAAARSYRGETAQEDSQKLEALADLTGHARSNPRPGDYRIGPEDLLEISVLEAPDLSRTLRVSNDGGISLPLLGSVRAAGRTPGELEAVVEDRLRHTYMKDPHVSVFVKEMSSHPVAVFGAVERPGVYQIREAKTLIEVLSMAQGLADDAGDTVIVMRNAGDSASNATAASTATAAAGGKTGMPAEAHEPVAAGVATRASSVEIHLKDLLDSSNPGYNVLVYPGDVVKVNRAGIVYVIGEVRKPGGFLLKTNESISVLQALALAEGLAAD